MSVLATLINKFKLSLLVLVLFTCIQQKETIDFPFKEKETQNPKTSILKPISSNIIGDHIHSKYTTEKGTLALRDSIFPLVIPVKRKLGQPFITENRLNSQRIPNSLPTTRIGSAVRVKVTASARLANGKYMLPEKPVVKPYLLPAIKDRDVFGIRNISHEQNLPGTNVYTQLTDYLGRIWVGTDNGLAMLDGESIHIYTTQEGLSDNRITCLLEPSPGEIWIGSEGGIDVFKPGLFIHYGINEGLNNNHVESLLKSSSGEIWIGTQGGGIDIFYNDSFKHFGLKEGLSHNRVNCLIESASRTFWIGTDHGLNMINSDTLSHYDIADGLKSNKINALLESASGELWIGTDQGVFVMVAGKLTHIDITDGLSSNNISSLHETISGDIWVGTDGGGVDIIQNNKIININSAVGLSSNRIWNITQTSNQDIWIGTSGGGVDVLRMGNFIHYNTEEYLNGHFVMSLTESKNGNIWIGTRGGLDVFNSEYFAHFGLEQGLSGSIVYSILETSEKTMWLGTDGGGIDIIESENITNLNTKHGLSNNKVFSLIESSDGTIWIGTYGGGLNTYRSGQFTHYTKEEGLSSNFILSMLETSDGSIWIGTENGGLNIIKSDSIFHIGKNEGLRNNSIICLLETSDGAKWIGTSGGLDIYKSGKITHYGIEEGLSNNAVLQLGIDSLENVWVGTGNGMTHFVKKDGQYHLTSWNKHHGLKYADFNAPGNPMIFTQKNKVSKKGTMWMGVGQTLTSFVPPQLDTLRPKILITGIDIQQQSINWYTESKNHVTLASEKANKIDTTFQESSESLLKVSKMSKQKNTSNLKGIYWDNTNDLIPYKLPQNLELAHDKNDIIFHYSGLKIEEQFDIVYRYMLEGQDETWSPITTEGSVHYRNLIPGTYTFKVRARGRNYLWSEEKQFSFVIHPPWWLTWWAIIVWTLLTACGVYFLYHLRIRYLIKQKESLEKTVVERTTEVTLRKEEIERQARELKVQTETLISLNNELNEAQKLANVGSWLFDPQTKKSEWTDQMFIIWDFDPKNGPPEFEIILERIHADDLDFFIKSVDDAVNKGIQYDIEFRITLPNKGFKNIRALCKPIMGANGRVESLSGTNQDITAQKLFEEAQTKHQRLKAIGEMSSSIAHDFNNSLQEMMGNLELIKFRKDLPEPVNEGLDNIKSIISDAADRVSSLQKFGESVPDEKSSKAVDLNKAIDESIKQSRPLWKDGMEKKGFMINISTCLNEIPKISCNSGELKSVIYNIIKNSVEAMPEGGEIIIKTGTKNQNVFFTITDTGLGMNEETKLKIFQPFYSTKGFDLGRGLGMSGVYSIVKKCGGDIKIKFSEISKGTTLELIFPIAYHEESPSPMKIEKEPFQQLNILWVDDDPMITKAVAQLVNMNGHKCTIVNSGKKALAYLVENSPDVVFTDIGMPDMNGWELIKAIRQQQGKSMKIVAVSGWHIDEDETDEGNINYILQKPFTLEDLNQLFSEIQIEN